MTLFISQVDTNYNGRVTLCGSCCTLLRVKSSKPHQIIVLGLLRRLDVPGPIRIQSPLSIRESSCSEIGQIFQISPFQPLGLWLGLNTIIIPEVGKSPKANVLRAFGMKASKTNNKSVSCAVPTSSGAHMADSLLAEDRALVQHTDRHTEAVGVGHRGLRRADAGVGSLPS